MKSLQSNFCKRRTGAIVGLGHGCDVPLHLVQALSDWRVQIVKKAGFFLQAHIGHLKRVRRSARRKKP